MTRETGTSSRLTPTKESVSDRWKTRAKNHNTTWTTCKIPTEFSNASFFNASDVDIWISHSDVNNDNYITLKPGAWSPVFRFSEKQAVWARASSGTGKRLEGAFWGD